MGRSELAGKVVAEIEELIVAVLLLLPLGDLPGGIVAIIKLRQDRTRWIEILNLLQALIAGVPVPAEVGDL